MHSLRRLNISYVQPQPMDLPIDKIEFESEYGCPCSIVPKANVNTISINIGNESSTLTIEQFVELAGLLGNMAKHLSKHSQKEGNK